MTRLLTTLLLLAVLPGTAYPAPPRPPAPPAAPAANGERAATSARDDAATRDDAAQAEPSHRTGTWPAAPSGKKVTLEGTMTVDQALGKIVDAAGWGLVANSGTEGQRSLTLRLRRVPVEDALDAVLQGTSLVASRRGTMITIGPGRPGPSAGERGAVAALDGAKSPKEVRRELRQQLREKKRELRGQHAGTGDRVARGDQVVKAGEAADDVVVIGGNVRLEPGATAQDVVAVLGGVELGPGAVASGDVVAVGGDVHLLPGAHVMGDVSSVGGKVITDVGAVIDGERTGVDVPGLAQVLAIVGGSGWTPHVSRAVSLAGLLARFAVFFALALLLMSIAPRRMEALTAGLSNAPMKTAITGVLGTIAIPLAAILLAVTVIGIPLIAVLVLGVLVAVVMGYSALALFIGRALPLPAKHARTVLQLALGTAVILILGEIPVLGWMVWVTGWLFVVGVVWRTRLGRPVVPPVTPQPVYATTVPPPIPPIEPPVPPSSGSSAPPPPPAPPVPPASGG